MRTKNHALLIKPYIILYFVGTISLAEKPSLLFNQINRTMENCETLVSHIAFYYITSLTIKRSSAVQRNKRKLSSLSTWAHAFFLFYYQVYETLN